MRLIDLVETSVELGVALDVRGRRRCGPRWSGCAGSTRPCPEAQRPTFDRERFRNPFGDVRIAVGPEDVELRTILLGIDIDVPELLLADRLRSPRAAHRRRDRPPHLRDRHRPLARPRLHAVAIEFLTGEGVPRDAAERVIGAYIEEKWRDQEDFHRIGPDTARLLGFPLACIHTPADYYIGEGVRPAVEAGAVRRERCGDVQRAIDALPEVQGAARPRARAPGS